MKIFWCLLWGTFIALGAICSLLVASLFSLTKAQLKRFSHHPNARARHIAKLMNRPLDVLITLLSLDVLGGILSQNAASNLVAGNGEESFVLKVALPWLVWVMFAELLPKIIGMQHNVRVALWAGRFLWIFDLALGAPRRFLVAATQIIARALFGFLKDPPPISTRELINSVNTAEGSSILTPWEKEVISGVLSLESVQVRQIMTPRSEIAAFDIDRPIGELHQLLLERGRDKIPLVRGTLDHFLGILFARDFLRAAPNNGEELLPLVKKPLFIPETLSVNMGLLCQMQESDQVLALAVDEYGVVSGLITLENLLGHIVGTHRSARGGKRRFWQMEDRAFIASGRWELDDAEEVLGIPFTHRKNLVTLGGFLTAEFGDIPKAGVKIPFGGHTFSILAADPNRVRRVHIRRK